MAGKSKKFRVATEGATTDGRNIERSWIEQMAKNYDPKKYGARVNMEHIKGYTPDSPFRRYGDVLSVTAEKVEDGKLGLFAVIDPTEDLIKMTTTDRQKVYSSIEISPKFADTGEAYLVGLAVTDDPASLGTEMLQFSANAKNSPLAKRKTDPDNLFSEAVEFSLELDDAAPAAVLENFAAKIKEMFSNSRKGADSNFSEVREAIETIADSQQQVLQELNSIKSGKQGQLVTADDGIHELTGKVESLSAEFGKLVEKLNSERSTPERARAAGGSQDIVTDC